MVTIVTWSAFEKEGREESMSFESESISFLPSMPLFFFHLSLLVALWDGLLEGRIKLQKCLSLSNQLPQNETAKEFAQSGSLASGSVHKCKK